MNSVQHKINNTVNYLAKSKPTQCPSVYQRPLNKVEEIERKQMTSFAVRTVTSPKS